MHRSKILTQWSLYCRNSDQKDLRKNISFMCTELSIPGFKKKMLVKIFMQVRQCILYYVLLLEVKWLLAGHLFPVQLPRFTSFHAQGVSLFCVQIFPSSSFWFEWTNFKINPFHLIVDFEAFWELSFWMCEPVEHFCISVKSGDGIKSGIYSKLKGGYQDQQSWRSLLLKSRNHGKEKRNPPWQPVCLCCVERKRRIGSCLESTQKCYCQSAEVIEGKSYRCNRLSPKFHKNFRQLINSPLGTQC